MAVSCPAPLKVSVLIDLEWRPTAGGHVKCWEKFAQAATRYPQDLDLTLHFLGDRPTERRIAENVRYLLHPPRFSTQRLPFLQDVPDHTDLMSDNPALIPYLETADIAHTTHPLFTFGKTAYRHCRTVGKPLVASVHTDTPQYTQIYLEQRLRDLLGTSWLKRLLLDRWQLPHRYRERMVAQQQDYWRACDHVLTAQPDDPEVQAAVSADRCSHLRRGIDLDLFNPARCDRNYWAARYSIPEHRFILLFVGRLDDCKNVMTFAHAAQQLIDQGLPIHAVAVGQGNRAAEIQALLGHHVTLPGVLDQEDLGPLFASADLFVFPSPTETIGNVILEAKASGLPVLISSQGGAHQTLKVDGEDGLLVASDAPEDWAAAIATLYRSPDRRAQMGDAAQKHIRQTWPSWQDVLEQDLLPIWQKLAHDAHAHSLHPSPSTANFD